MAIQRYNTCTIWSAGIRDPRSGISSTGVARVYKCELKRGGKTKFTDRSGAEFFPTSTFWVRLTDLVTGIHIEPSEGEMIAQGDHSAVTKPATVNAEIIKGVIIHDHAKFGESESYTIGTGA